MFVFVFRLAPNAVGSLVPVWGFSGFLLGFNERTNGIAEAGILCQRLEFFFGTRLQDQPGVVGQGPELGTQLFPNVIRRAAPGKTKVQGQFEQALDRFGNAGNELTEGDHHTGAAVSACDPVIRTTLSHRWRYGPVALGLASRVEETPARQTVLRTDLKAYGKKVPPNGIGSDESIPHRALLIHELGKGLRQALIDLALCQ